MNTLLHITLATWRALPLTGLVLILMLHPFLQASAGPVAEPTPAVLPEAAQTELEQHWGIRVLSLRQSASGYMLDFRYRVVDPLKAQELLNRKLKPQLIVNKSGNRLQVPSPPKLGPLRQSSRAPRADTNYFIFFANPGRQVEIGDAVSIQIGDLEIAGLTVTRS